MSTRILCFNGTQDFVDGHLKPMEILSPARRPGNFGAIAQVQYWHPGQTTNALYADGHAASYKQSEAGTNAYGAIPPKPIRLRWNQ